MMVGSSRARDFLNPQSYRHNLRKQATVENLNLTPRQLFIIRYELEDRMEAWRYAAFEDISNIPWAKEMQAIIELIKPHERY